MPDFTEPDQPVRTKLLRYCPICNYETSPRSLNCPNCGVNLKIARANLIQQTNQPKLLGDFSYIVIGFFTNLVVSVLLFAIMLGILIIPDVNPDGISLLGFLLYIAYGFSLTYISTLGRYGKVNFYGFMNLMILSVIPFINWSVVFYFGKGLHISYTKQKLFNPPIATKTGTVIFSVVIFIWFVAATLSTPTTSAVHRTPTLIPPKLPTAKPFSLTKIAENMQRNSQPAQTSCLLWSQVTPQMAGQTLCVYGTIYQITSSRETYSRYEFSPKRNTFFMYNISGYFYHTDTGKDVVAGECISDTEVLKLIDGVPYIDVGNEIAFCEPWMK